VLDTFILYTWLPSGGRAKMQERMQRTMDLLVSDIIANHGMRRVLSRLSVMIKFDKGYVRTRFVQLHC
jgi:hypothetical protein